MVCIFAVNLMFMMPSDHAVDQMYVSLANKILKYILNLIVFQITDLVFF